jgi:hypothetical protein
MHKRIALAVLFVMSILCLTQISSSSPLYGGDKPSVAKELPSNEREVKLNYGIADCVRTAWIGDINNRTLICVQYRYKKEVK